MSTSILARPKHGTTTWNCLVLAGVHVAWGLSILTQPHRWTATPAYADLFKVLPEAWWGVIYLIGSVGLIVGVYALRLRATHTAIRLAITYNFILTAAWGAAFLVRYLTSQSTTPFTFGSSVIQLYLLITASMWLNREAPPILA